MAVVQRFSRLTNFGRNCIFLGRDICRPRSCKGPFGCRSYYYVGPKKKKGPGLKGWLVAGGVLAGMTGFGIVVLGRPETEEQHQRYASERVLWGYCLRARDVVKEYGDTFAMPSSAVLLPDPLPPLYQPPYTLVLEMNDILIHAEYELKSGWRYRKRPGLTAFLHELAPFYEIVIFTTEAGFNGQPVIAALDPRGEAVFYALFRDSTTYVKGKHIKDLNNLNRDLRQVVALDVDPASCERNKQNVLILKRWEGNMTDGTLIDLIPFLKTIAMSGVDDVRPVIEFYQAQDDPIIAFKQNQAQLQAEEQQRQMNESKASPAGGSNWSSSGLFGRFFGRGSGQSHKEPNSKPAVETAVPGGHATSSAEQLLQSVQPKSGLPINSEAKAEQTTAHAQGGTVQQENTQTLAGEKSLFSRWLG